jgi:hypothetical protein
MISSNCGSILHRSTGLLSGSTATRVQHSVIYAAQQPTSHVCASFHYRVRWTVG